MADGSGGKKPLNRDTNRLGDSFIFPPRVMDDIHIKSELGRYRMRGFSLFKKIPHWDDLTFLPGHADPFRDRGVSREMRDQDGHRAARQEAPSMLDIPVYVTGMSFGALSYRGQDGAGARRHHGRHRDLLGRGRHDPRRAALFVRNGSISASSRATASTRTI